MKILNHRFISTSESISVESQHKRQKEQTNIVRSGCVVFYASVVTWLDVLVFLCFFGVAGLSCILSSMNALKFKLLGQSQPLIIVPFIVKTKQHF